MVLCRILGIMGDPTDRLITSLEGRYRTERELGEGGIATVYQPKTSGMSLEPPRR